MEEKIVFTTKEAAKYLGVSQSTIYRMEKLGLISSIRTPGGQRRFSREIIERYLQESQNFEAPQNPSKYKKSAVTVKEPEASYTVIKINIEKELQKIYKEMRKWPKINKKLNYVVPSHEINRRELILSLQQILYKIEDAKKEGDNDKENFNLALYFLTKSVEE